MAKKSLFPFVLPIILIVGVLLGFVVLGTVDMRPATETVTMEVPAEALPE